MHRLFIHYLTQLRENYGTWLAGHKKIDWTTRRTTRLQREAVYSTQHVHNRCDTFRRNFDVQGSHFLVIEAKFSRGWMKKNTKI